MSKESLLPIYDAETLEQLQDLIDGDDTSFLDDLFESYLTTAKENICSLKGDTDPDILRRAAHTLKGSSLNVGARRVAEVCKHLEAALKDGSVPDMPERLERIEAHLQTVEQSYASKLKELAESAS